MTDPATSTVHEDGITPRDGFHAASRPVPDALHRSGPTSQGPWRKQLWRTAFAHHQVRYRRCPLSS